MSYSNVKIGHLYKINYPICFIGSEQDTISFVLDNITTMNSLSAAL